MKNLGFVLIVLISLCVASHAQSISGYVDTAAYAAVQNMTHKAVNQAIQERNEMAQLYLSNGISTNDLELVKKAVRQGANMDEGIIDALRLGHYDIANYLLDQGAKVKKTKDRHGDTPLTALLMFRDKNQDEPVIHLMKRLIKRGASVKTPNNYGCTPLDIVYWSPNLKKELMRLAPWAPRGQYCQITFNPEAVSTFPSPEDEYAVDN